MTTTKVRIAVAVFPDGEWHACGGTTYDDRSATDELAMCLGRGGYTIRWITAEVPVPTEAPELPEIVGEAEPKP